MYQITSKAFTSGLPGEIKVGPLYYQVVLATDPVAEIEGERVPVYGMVNFRKTEITIADDLQPALAWQCLFHEVFHIFFEHSGLEEPGEGQIDNLAYMLLGFMLDNGFLLEQHFPAMESFLNTQKARE